MYLISLLFSVQECKETLGQSSKANITPMCIAKVLGMAPVFASFNMALWWTGYFGRQRAPAYIHLFSL
jgi:hypothetical protein